MGQQHSSERTESVPVRTSYYELLGVEKSASDDEVKKAYRRKALELHPDRNYGRVEEATKLFTDIQAAYEVLSDPQERAWYDSHEDAVLSGFDGEDSYTGDGSVTTSDDIAKLYANFSGKNDFTDSPNGFFTSLREVFERLAREEQLCADYSNNEVPDYPSFGSAEDDYNNVVKPFYDQWAGFTTRKSFSWKELYRLSEAPDRRVRRAMEKENKRLRDEAIRDFNDTVRTLVAFVKKRDTRVKAAHFLSDAQRQQNLREQTAAQAARARAANLTKLNDHVEADWVKTGDVEPENEFVWEEEEPDAVEHFECVVCDKVFKTEKQYEAHERSKKHIQAVKQIQRQMRKEGVELGLEQTTAASGPVGDPSHESDNDGDVSPVDAEVQPTVPNEPTAVPQEPEDSVPSDSKQTSEQDEHDHSSVSTNDDDYAPRESIAERVADLDSLTLSDETPESSKDPDPKLGKAKEKRARKAAKKSIQNDQASDCVCVRCQAQFPSKTQLFNHLKKNPSHAQPIQKATTASRKDKKR